MNRKSLHPAAKEQDIPALESVGLPLINDVTANFPAELRARDQWVCWRLEIRNDRPTKVPYSPITGGRAKTTIAST